jgi:hypothetical protein
MKLLHTSQVYRITSTKCRINADVSPDDGPREVRNMQRLYIKLTKYTENIVHQVGFIYKILHEFSFAVHMQGIRRGNNATDSSLKEYRATRVYVKDQHSRKL